MSHRTATNQQARSRRRTGHRIKLGLVLALTCLAVTSAAPATASADAFGVQFWGSHTVNVKGQTIGIPSGELAHLTEGQGSYVRKDAANFLSFNICNWRIDFRYSDVNGYVYQRNRGPVTYACSRYGSRFTYPRVNKRPGKTCAQLYRSGEFVAQQCHYILR